MASHYHWEAAVIKRHKMQKPFAPENGRPLQFKIGDPVVYTNDYGVMFAQKVIGLYQPGEMTSLYATGYRYYLDKVSHWMPVKEVNLSPAACKSQKLPP